MQPPWMKPSSIHDQLRNHHHIHKERRQSYWSFGMPLSIYNSPSIAEYLDHAKKYKFVRACYAKWKKKKKTTIINYLTVRKKNIKNKSIWLPRVIVNYLSKILAFNYWRVWSYVLKYLQLSALRVHRSSYSFKILF